MTLINDAIHSCGQLESESRTFSDKLFGCGDDDDDMPGGH